MEVKILELLEGAQKAHGIAVVIDVFRAFTTACHAFSRGAHRIYPVEALAEALDFREQNPSVLLAGERGGFKQQGFDFGNSPSELEHLDLTGKTIVHTTSAGTQGVQAAARAGCRVLVAGLVNADATAKYILSQKPDVVSLVAMGLAGERQTQEDMLCARYIESRLKGQPFSFDGAVQLLRQGDGARFFDPTTQRHAPERAFWLALEVDRFDFALPVKRDEHVRLSIDC